MRIKHIKLYQYDELSPEAQERARDWYRNADAGDNYFAESVTEDFQTIATACGFSLGDRRGNGIYWSGFASQGDGASFTASWRAERVSVAALLADRPAVAPDGTPCKYNATLRPILEAFAALAADEPTGYGTVEASHRGHNLRCEYDCSVAEGEVWEVFETHRDALTDRFGELARDLADWFYRALESEYDYVNSDEQVAETIRANEYEFTEEGERA